MVPPEIKLYNLLMIDFIPKHFLVLWSVVSLNRDFLYVDIKRLTLNACRLSLDAIPLRA